MEKFKIFRSDRLGRLAAMLVCFSLEIPSERGAKRGHK
nr:MAG TPA: hypothetical protein [Caudoviricetes sp.]